MSGSVGGVVEEVSDDVNEPTVSGSELSLDGNDDVDSHESTANASGSSTAVSTAVMLHGRDCTVDVGLQSGLQAASTGSGSRQATRPVDVVDGDSYSDESGDGLDAAAGAARDVTAAPAATTPRSLTYIANVREGSDDGELFYHVIEPDYIHIWRADALQNWIVEMCALLARFERLDYNLIAALAHLVLPQLTAAVLPQPAIVPSATQIADFVSSQRFKAMYRQHLNQPSPRPFFRSPTVVKMDLRASAVVALSSSGDVLFLAANDVKLPKFISAFHVGNGGGLSLARRLKVRPINKNADLQMRDDSLVKFLVTSGARLFVCWLTSSRNYTYRIDVLNVFDLSWFGVAFRLQNRGVADKVTSVTVDQATGWLVVADASWQVSVYTPSGNVQLSFQLPAQLTVFHDFLPVVTQLPVRLTSPDQKFQVLLVWNGQHATMSATISVDRTTSLPRVGETPEPRRVIVNSTSYAGRSCYLRVSTLFEFANETNSFVSVADREDVIALYTRGGHDVMLTRYDSSWRQTSPRCVHTCDMLPEAAFEPMTSLCCVDSRRNWGYVVHAKGLYFVRLLAD